MLLGHNPLAEAFEPEHRARMGMSTRDDEPLPVVVELNLLHEGGLPGATAQFTALFDRLIGTRRPKPRTVSKTYVRCDLTMDEVRTLLRTDMIEHSPRRRAIYRVWPDFPVKRMIDRSISTVKADAAQRSYAATGAEITWAVIDTGVAQRHPHFRRYDNLGGEIALLHRDFTLPDDAPVDKHRASALTDDVGHGTHVAGIIAGGLPATLEAGADFRVGQHVLGTEQLKVPSMELRAVTNPERLAGVAPRCQIVSLKVFDDKGRSCSTNVIRALEYVRESLNGNGKLLRVHGVNLSLGYEFNAKWFACGQSPICVEVDRLVRSGVVVVVAAGNTGYGELTSREGVTSTGLSLTINDPGNAALAITVGATHRDSPHTFGVSYFSSKGPTGDGRLKPDLVAPGERITSCAAGKRLTALYDGQEPPAGAAAYVDDSGTSMAAPHVSGAIAAFLSIRREFIGRAEDVKRIFLENATSLARERYFQGHGLVDLMRAIQAV